MIVIVFQCDSFSLAPAVVSVCVQDMRVERKAHTGGVKQEFGSGRK